MWEGGGTKETEMFAVILGERCCAAVFAAAATLLTAVAWETE